MRRLDIAVPGTSQAMTELARELELHGHGVVDLQSPVDLLIDDGTTPRAIEARSYLQIRVALRTLPGEALPQPVLVFRDGAQRLLCQDVIAPQTRWQWSVLAPAYVGNSGRNRRTAGQPVLPGRKLLRSLADTTR
ncbi:hypothetical protein PSH84_05595 [Pseudomonas beijingensis]|nr:hypothetical protein [Pseudomonas sp. FP830]WLI46377.1 hypothetical protein PSH84_05595 [Pseudomonas sp. FP830]